MFTAISSNLLFIIIIFEDIDGWQMSPTPIHLTCTKFWEFSWEDFFNDFSGWTIVSLIHQRSNCIRSRKNNLRKEILSGRKCHGFCVFSSKRYTKYLSKLPLMTNSAICQKQRVENLFPQIVRKVTQRKLLSTDIKIFILWTKAFRAQMCMIKRKLETGMARTK